MANEQKNSETPKNGEIPKEKTPGTHKPQNRRGQKSTAPRAGASAGQSIKDAVKKLGESIAPGPKKEQTQKKKSAPKQQAKQPQSVEAQPQKTQQKPQKKRSSRSGSDKRPSPAQAAQAVQAAKQAQAAAEGKKAGGQQPRRRNGRQKHEERKPPVRIIPLGGLGEIGKNITVIECQNDMIVVDCGIAFPDEEMLGIDLVIPDFSYIERNRDRLRGVILTHGHEDHIGSLPYLLKKVNTPIYSRRLTLGLVEGKLREHGLLGKVQMHEVKPHDVIAFGCISVEVIHVNHSIPDACALAIHTPAGVIIMTGDYKIDYTPIQGEIIDLPRFGELGSQGVLALLADSTNATRPGATASERTVGNSFDSLFAKAADRRILIATFASNIHRIQQIITAAAKYGRKVAVSGRSMENVVSTAVELGYLDVPDNLLIEIDGVKRYRPDQVVIITTGSQGEPMSALTRMAMGEHRKVQVTPNDFIIISATPIPGNEKLVNRVINELMRLGAEVIYEKMYEVHVSGHACQDELKTILSLTRPKFYMPVHGEYMHLISGARVGQSLGIPAENIIVTEIGKVVETDGVEMKVVDTVPAGRVMVDGLGVGDVGSIVLRDRKLLGEDGLIVIVCTINGETGEIVAGPDIVSRGFVYVREAEEMMEETRRIARQAIENCMSRGVREWGNIKNRVKDDVSNYLYQATKRSPMILPVIEEI